MLYDVEIIIQVGNNMSQESLTEAATMNTIGMNTILFNTLRPLRPYMRIIPTSPATPELFEAKSLSQYNFAHYCQKIMLNEEKQQLQTML